MLNEKYRGIATQGFKKDVERLKKGEPVDYVIGWTEFLGCRIDLSCRPFIPRPETEYWVRQAMKSLRAQRSNPVVTTQNLGIAAPRRNVGARNDDDEVINCLDLFAGSGCIGIAILKHIPDVHLDFRERNGSFCDQIRKNLDANSIEPSRYRVIRSDVFSRMARRQNVPSPRYGNKLSFLSTIADKNEHYDCILANPPYGAEKRKTRVQKSVLKWEPKHAIFGGNDGLFYIKKILIEAPHYLKKGGKLFMEFDSPQKKDIDMILDQSRFSHYSFFRDQYGRWRYLVAIR